MVTVLQPGGGPSTRDSGALSFLGDLYELLVDGLTTASTTLAGTAGMGGRVTAFTGAYDGLALQLTTTGCQLAGAVAKLRLLIGADLDNYLRSGGAATLAPIQGPPTHVGGRVRVTTPAPTVPPPPSSVGDNGGEPRVWSMVTKAFGNAQWPDIDTGKLRTAASAWSNLAASYSQAGPYVECAVAVLEGYSAPEVPTICAVLEGLGRQLASYGAQCSSLANGLDTTATNADVAVAQIRSKCGHVEIEASASLGAAAVAGLFTIWAGGSGGVVTEAALNALIAGSAGATIAGLATDFLATIVELAEAYEVMLPVIQDADFVAASIMSACVVDVDVDAAVGKELSTISATFSIPDLIRFELKSDTHVVARHIYEPDSELRARLATDPIIRAASSFTSAHTASEAISEVTDRNLDRILDRISRGKQRVEVEADLGWVAGRVATRDGAVKEATRVKVVFVPDPSTPLGFRPKTAFLLP